VVRGLDETCRKLMSSALDALKKMLEVDYRKRITVAEALEHQFFADPAPYHLRIQYAIADNIS
jgi:serine/threonine protein kinase